MEEKVGVKHRVLFVCLGNICRSPAAEGVMKHIIEREGVSHLFEVDSAGIQGYHSGESADKRMIVAGRERGYNFTSISRKFNRNEDFKKFDYIIGMDHDNVAALKGLAECDSELAKIHIMTSFNVDRDDSFVPDPYYGGEAGFYNVIDIVEDCCLGIVEHLCPKKNK